MIEQKSDKSLFELCIQYDCDKVIDHDYITIYERLFEGMRTRPITLLEIGVGGYENQTEGGNSLRVWSDYFPNGTIVGIDVCSKELSLPSNVHVHQVDQRDRECLKTVIAAYRHFDVVIDDGSHIPKDIEAAFVNLFPTVSDGGYYIIEDIQTSFNQDFDGGLEVDRFNVCSLVQRIVQFQHRREWKPELSLSVKDPYCDKVGKIEVHYNHIVICKSEKTQFSNLDTKNGVPRMIEATLGLRSSYGAIYPGYWLRLARYYEMQDAHSEAKKCLEEGLHNFPEHGEICRALTKIDDRSE